MIYHKMIKFIIFYLFFCSYYQFLFLQINFLFKLN
jgi:hypothetical protein